MMNIYYNLQEAFFAFPPEFVSDRVTQSAPVVGEKEFYWMACELAGLACVDSFMENGALTLSSTYYAQNVNNSLTLCGATAHLNPDTGMLLGANLDDLSQVMSYEVVSLPTDLRPTCGLGSWACCSAQSGMRNLSDSERSILTQWAQTVHDYPAIEQSLIFRSATRCLTDLTVRAVVGSPCRQPSGFSNHTSISSGALLVQLWHRTANDIKWYFADALEVYLVMNFAAIIIGILVSRWRGASWSSIWAVSLYFVINPLMLLCNKVVVTILPFPTTILLLQFAFATVVLKVLGSPPFSIIEVEPLCIAKVWSFGLVSGSLSLIMLANMHILKDLPIETVVCLRSVAPVVLVVPDYLLFNRNLPSSRSLLCLIGSSLCMVLYAIQELLQIDVQVLAWLLIWFFLLIFESVALKLAMVKVTMSNWTRSYYTNAMGIFVVTLPSLMEISEAKVMFGNLLPWELTVLILSCVLGFLMSYCAYLVRDIFATSMGSLVTNGCKWIAIVSDAIMWNQHASPVGICLVLTSLLFTLGYSPPAERPDQMRKN
jgi:GDP-mannose transporter